MSPDLFLVVSENVAIAILAVAVAMVLIRLIRGPTLPDRVLALDMLTVLSIRLSLPVPKLTPAPWLTEELLLTVLRTRETVALANGPLIPMLPVEIPPPIPMTELPSIVLSRMSTVPA